jgi:integrase
MQPRSRSRARAKREIESKDHALRWLFQVVDKAPHEMTRADVDRFMTKAANMGTRPPRLVALRFAIELAFDQMCGHPIATRAPSGPPPRPRPRERELSRERLIACLAGELGLTPRDIERIRWEHIDFDGQMIILPAHTGSGRRRIALTRRANDLLEASRPPGGAQESFVFADPPDPARCHSGPVNVSSGIGHVP